MAFDAGMCRSEQGIPRDRTAWRSSLLAPPRASLGGGGGDSRSRPLGAARAPARVAPSFRSRSSYWNSKVRADASPAGTPGLNVMESSRVTIRLGGGLRTPSERFFAAVREGAFVVLVSEAPGPGDFERSGRGPGDPQGASRPHGGRRDGDRGRIVGAGLHGRRGRPRRLARGRDPRRARLGRAGRRRRQLELAHLVQLRRIRGFHAVNVLRGDPLIEIRSPLDVIDDEEA